MKCVVFLLPTPKCFAKFKFQTFEPNSEIGAVHEQTIELLHSLLCVSRVRMSELDIPKISAFCDGKH